MKRDVRQCLECGWQIRDDEYDDPSALMIDHAVETGHGLVSCTELETEERRRSLPVRPPFWYRR